MITEQKNNQEATSKILAKHVVSLGSCCHVATFLKNENLKFESYPFDWVFSGPKMNYEIITDGFKTFLDSSQYTNLTEHRSGHKIYGHRFFNHKDPKTEKDYEYYKRCISRFYHVVNSKDHKVFIITNVIDKGVRWVVPSEEIEYTNKLHDHFKSVSTNFSLLYIDPIKISDDEYSKLAKCYEIVKTENLYWIKLYVTSDSDGVRFANAIDRDQYKAAIFSLFDFDLENKK
jgi:hypothetical protein